MTTLLRRITWPWNFALLTAITMTGLTLLALGVVRNAGAMGETAQASATKKVEIKNFAFHPGTLRVAKGTRVAFSNFSSVTHTATKGGSFDTGNIKPGKTVVVRFTKKGSFAYHCKIHPSMKGKIVVN
jgi:plastocyanin